MVAHSRAALGSIMKQKNNGFIALWADVASMRVCRPDIGLAGAIRLLGLLGMRRVLLSLSQGLGWISAHMRPRFFEMGGKDEEVVVVAWLCDSITRGSEVFGLRRILCVLTMFTEL